MNERLNRMDGLQQIFSQAIRINDRQMYDSIGAARPEPLTQRQSQLWQSLCVFAQQRGVTAFPSSPALVAYFMAHIAEEFIEEALEAIVKTHNASALANPCCTPVVLEVLQRRLKIDYPPGFNRADKNLFIQLPADLQATVFRREVERTTALRRAQNALADERKKLQQAASAAQAKEETNGNERP